MTGCDEERERIAAEVAARVTRHEVTEAWLAENEAKQSLYRRKRAAWVAEWRKSYGQPDEPETVIDPQFVTGALPLK